MPASVPPPAALLPGRLTLFSLPDEILAEIFQHVHAAYQLEKPGSPPLSYLLIHPRLNKLLWTIWDSVLVVPENATAVDRFRARYTARPAFLEHIRDLYITMSSPSPDWVVALFDRLSKLSRLRALRIEQSSDGAISVDQPPFDVIATMKCFKVLRVPLADYAAEIKPDGGFRSVKKSLFPGVIALNNLEFLILHITHDGPLDNYRWQTLVAFETVLEDECQQLPQQFLRDLSEQTKSVAESQNLGRLRITLTHKMFDVASFCSTVLDCFASADLQHLELDLGSHLDLYALKIPCERFKRLTIRADWHMTSSKDYSRLTTRLAAFGQLTALTLINLRWDTDVNLLDVEPPASKPSHYRRLPALYTFVQDVAESTNILQLCISDDDSASARACELRFIRRLGEARFQVDRFTGGECRNYFPVAF